MDHARSLDQSRGSSQRRIVRLLRDDGDHIEAPSESCARPIDFAMPHGSHNPGDRRRFAPCSELIARKGRNGLCMLAQSHGIPSRCHRDYAERAVFAAKPPTEHAVTTSSVALRCSRALHPLAKHSVLNTLEAICAQGSQVARWISMAACCSGSQRES